jgi:hypothetical protein
LKTGRFGFCRAAHFLFLHFYFWGIFLWWGGRAFFQGVFAKKGVFCVGFCGEVVVNCVVNRSALMAVFGRLKICHGFELFF